MAAAVISKVAIVLCIATAIKASGYADAGYGYSAQPYSFGYDTVGGGGAHARKEYGDGAGNVKGSYSLAVADGRKRYVDYVADAYGFRAKIRTNEPGTDSKSPADVYVDATPSYGYGHAAGYGGHGNQGGYGYGGYGPGNGLNYGGYH